MKALVIYDSLYGNTEKVAKAMAEALGKEAKAVRVGQVKPADIKDYAYIIIGSPTQGGRPTKATQAFLETLKEDDLTGKRFAAFDTRFKGIAKIFGYAAPRIEKSLKQKRANCTAQPQGYFVKGTKGPVEDGELERAATWAKAIVAGVPTNLMPGEFKVKNKE
jgi:flavodoxin I